MMQRLLLFVFFLSLVSPNYSQPGGEVYRALAESGTIQREIDEISKKILESPNNSDLYSQRGFLNLKILEIVHGIYYINSQFPSKISQYSVETITNLGIKDFSKAIEIEPKAEYYAGRGKLYSSLWYAYSQQKSWFDEKRKLIPDSKKEQLLLTNEKIELILFEKFLNNKEFTSAESDLTKSLKINEKSEYANQVRQELVKLYLARTSRLISSVNYDKRILVENEFNYSIRNDLNKAFNFVNQIPQSEFTTEKYISSLFWKLRDYHRFETNLFNPLDAYLRLASYADTYSKYNLVADKLTLPVNQFENFIRGNQRCWFYYNRSIAFNELGEYKRALENLNRKELSSLGSNKCSQIYFAKGNALLGMNLLREAIEAYTKVFENQHNMSSRLRIRTYNKRASAYLKLGNYKNALEDFTSAYKSSTDFLYAYERFDLHIKFAQLKLQIYKKLNKQDEILESKDQIKNNEFYKKKYKIVRTVFGTVVDKEGNALTDTNVFVRIEFTKPVYYWSHKKKHKKGGYSGSPLSYNFSYHNLPNESFRIYAYIERKINGDTYRLFNRTKVLKVKGKILGPIELKLDKTIKIKGDEDLP